MPAIVAKIDIQILHLLSQFSSCVLLYFFFLRRAAVWQEKDQVTVSVEGTVHRFFVTLLVESFHYLQVASQLHTYTLSHRHKNFTKYLNKISS